MSKKYARYAPGRVRDAVIHVLSLTSRPLSVREIENRVSQAIGPTPGSSVRSYLRLNTPDLFVRETRGMYTVQRAVGGVAQKELFEPPSWREPFSFGKVTIYHADCFDWIDQQEDSTIHAVVTDPPYGLYEYLPEQQN